MHLDGRNFGKSARAAEEIERLRAEGHHVLSAADFDATISGKHEEHFFVPDELLLMELARSPRDEDRTWANDWLDFMSATSTDEQRREAATRIRSMSTTTEA